MGAAFSQSIAEIRPDTTLPSRGSASCNDHSWRKADVQYGNYDQPALPRIGRVLAAGASTHAMTDQITKFLPASR
jgi:hypothetical protein